MNIHSINLNNQINNFQLSIPTRFKPLVYLVSAIAIAVLIYRFCPCINDLKSRLWEVKDSEDKTPVKDLVTDAELEKELGLRFDDIEVIQLLGIEERFPEGYRCNIVYKTGTKWKITFEKDEYEKLKLRFDIVNKDPLDE